jgi:hypothetical protein
MPVDSGRSKNFAGLGAEPLTCMNESRPALTLINSDYNARLEADVARMLEDVPAEEAMQQLRVLRRRIQPAANSLIATVVPATSE